MRQSISPSLRFRVFQRDGHVCQYCGRGSPDIELEVDHVLAVSLGGENDFANLITACVECNIGKGAKLLQDLSVIERSRSPHRLITAVGWAEGPVVIGLTDDVARQRAAIESGLPCPVRCFVAQPVEASLALQAEAAAHDAVAHRRLRTRWFSLSAQDAIYVVSAAVMRTRFRSGLVPLNTAVDFHRITLPMFKRLAA